ncbi:MAG TPA: wax ester/triacylglycerol synthase family O-acyltransferase [Polyangiaceae bacterium]
MLGGSGWERLSALDAMFLGIESDNAPMHVGALTVFEGKGLLDQAGNIDRGRYRQYVQGFLKYLPRFRRRLTRVPLLGRPVLVTDDAFDLDHHLQFTAARSNDPRELESIAAEIFSRPLDRQHPLWEQHAIERLGGDRFATLTKVHHAVLDGMSGMGSLLSILRTAPDPAASFGPPPLFSVPPPGADLLSAELRHRGHDPAALYQRLRDFSALRARVRNISEGCAALTSGNWRPAPETILNPQAVGPRRCFRGVKLDLEEVKAVRRASGTKINDVVLATVAGALRRFFEHRRLQLGDEPLRCMVPVSLHEAASHDVSGNAVSILIVPLFARERDPVLCLRAIAAATRDAKRRHQSDAFAVTTGLAEWGWSGLMPWVTRLAMQRRPFNLVVTNVPGPPYPLYLLDAKLTELYPVVPLFQNQGLGIALVSYAGSLFWGLNADADLLPDLQVLADAIVDSFAELRNAHLAGARQQLSA